jgi:hypothetical protein
MKKSAAHARPLEVEHLSEVGQVGNLRSIGNRPGAGPRKLQPCVHRIPLYYHHGDLGLVEKAVHSEEGLSGVPAAGKRRLVGRLLTE